MELTPTTPANLCVGLFRNYLNTVAVSKRECDRGKSLEKSSIKTYASCVNCFINQIAKDRPLNKVLHPNFLSASSRPIATVAFERISMDRNGLKIFKEFYGPVQGQVREPLRRRPADEDCRPETIQFKQGDTTEQVMLQQYRNNF